MSFNKCTHQCIYSSLQRRYRTFPTPQKFHSSFLLQCRIQSFYSSVMSHVSVVASTLSLSSVQWYGYSTICSSIHWLLDIWFVSSLWPLWVRLLRFMCKVFMCMCCFHLSWLNILEWNFGVLWYKKLPNCACTT